MATNMWSSGGFLVAGMTPQSGQIICLSCDTGIVATGLTQLTAAPLASNINIIGSTSGAPGDGTAGGCNGVMLPSAIAIGATITVYNLLVGTGVNVIVYPPIGGTINGVASTTNPGGADGHTDNLSSLGGEASDDSGTLGPLSMTCIQIAPLTYVTV